MTKVAPEVEPEENAKCLVGIDSIASVVRVWLSLDPFIK